MNLIANFQFLYWVFEEEEKLFLKKWFYLDRGGKHPGNQHCKEKRKQQFHSKKIMITKDFAANWLLLCIKHSKLM